MRKFVTALLCLWLAAPWAAWADAVVWKLGGSGLFIAGSIHVLRDTDYPLPPEFDLAYRNVDRIIFETDIEAMGSLDTPSMLAAKGLYLDGGSLSRNLSPPVYQRLAEHLRSRGLPPEQFEPYKPWMVMLTLTMIELQANGITPEYGVDRYFYERAKRDGKTTGGLEEPQAQIDALAALGDEFGDAMIESQLDEMQAMPEMIDELIASWRSGNAAALNSLLIDNVRDAYPRIYEKVFAQRNRNWLEPIEDLARSGERVMVIVGSGHLVGEDGLIQLLEQRGHSLSRLDASP